MMLSVEISTYNRKDVLRMVLERLSRQTYPADGFEVVVADDGSTDGTAGLVESIRHRLPYSLSYFNDGHHGCGYTHNLGITRAKGDIVLMLADDILPEPRLLEEHMLTHAANPDPSVFVVGKLRQSADLPGTVFQRCWDPITGRDPEGKTALGYTDFWVSNISFKRDFMLRNGMFVDLPAASHEDIELGYRLQRKGMRLVFNKKALGYHHHPETIESVSARSYRHGYNWPHFESHVPELWIRARSGNISLKDGTALYLTTLIKGMLRKVVINKFLISSIALPVIRKAEEMPALSFAVPFLMMKVASYHFQRGLDDSKKKIAVMRDGGLIKA